MCENKVASESRDRMRVYCVWLKARSLVKDCAHVAIVEIVSILPRVYRKEAAHNHRPLSVCPSTSAVRHIYL